MNAMKTDLHTFLDETLIDLDKKDLKRRLRRVEGRQGREIMIEGRRVLNFCSNNYLGLADDPRLCRAAIDCIEREGLGSGAARLVCGNLSVHEILEEKIARFKGTERALIFNTGYMANVGIISGLFGRGDMIFSDRLNHASIVDGILLSQAEMKRYPHGDVRALEQMLQSATGYKKKMIVTDSVFSMDGDIAPLKGLASLAQKYNCMIMVDEAHTVGVLGKNGKGAVEHFGLEGKIDIQMGTFSKAVGAFGAYVCGSAKLIDFLINKARTFIYTTGLPPSVAAAARQGIEIIEQEPDRREKLLENTRYLKSRLNTSGFDTMATQTPIIPILLKEASLAVEFSKRLCDRGIFVSAIRPPTVPAHTARLRVTVMATHRKEDLDFLVGQCTAIGQALCIL